MRSFGQVWENGSVALDVSRQRRGITKARPKRGSCHGGTKQRWALCGRSVDQSRYPAGRHLAVIAPFRTVGKLAPALLHEPFPQIVRETRLQRDAKIPTDDIIANRRLAAAPRKSAFLLQMQQATHTATQRQCHDEILSRRRSTRSPDAEQNGSTLVVSSTGCWGNGIPPKNNRNRYAFLNAVGASTYLFEGRARHVEASATGVAYARECTPVDGTHRDGGMDALVGASTGARSVPCRGP